MRKEKGRVNDLSHGELKPTVAVAAAHGAFTCSDRDTAIEVKWVVA